MGIFGNFLGNLGNFGNFGLARVFQGTFGVSEPRGARRPHGFLHAARRPHPPPRPRGFLLRRGEGAGRADHLGPELAPLQGHRLRGVLRDPIGALGHRPHRPAPPRRPHHRPGLPGREEPPGRHGRAPAEGLGRPRAPLRGLAALQHHQGHAEGHLRALRQDRHHRPDERPGHGAVQGLRVHHLLGGRVRPARPGAAQRLRAGGAADARGPGERAPRRRHRRHLPRPAPRAAPGAAPGAQHLAPAAGVGITAPLTCGDEPELGTAAGRLQLMAKLAEGSGLQLPAPAQAALQQLNGALTPLGGLNPAALTALSPALNLASQCLTLSGLFSPQTM
ncbi:probable RNA-binding protein 23 isoform X1 [Camarhynchus parvulus]|uniref:probable RNA-binding protein 23 isoform X1 n=1 Tax=Geospiza parvula TaxID=87175 RepID=UPI001237F479|nr:probable RNA-binding protein 23 isoform X1 [Camarhynchus parvulus]